MISDLENSRGHGLGRSPRNRHPRVNFLVDAHTADVLFYYSAAPTVAVPVKCKGTDEDNVQRTFFAQQAGTGIELVDPMRFVKTYDLKLGDIDDATAFPEAAIQSASSDLGTAHKAAISALWNATQVYDFYNDVLQRHGIDDKGMDLVSVVNCTYAEDEPAPEWHNAVWFNKRMWYGQISNGTSLLSYSRFLDVIAHELTHGVTQFTSNLVYKNESGALNESFSDIFGIIISNWVRVGKDSEVKDWSWEFGPGLGDSGLPLRDLSDPTRTGDPDHTSKYVPTPFDSGGVHTNSNIHNKAAYNVLTEVGANGDRVFPVREVAILYYLCLTRLGSLATFQKTLQELIDVASTFYGGDPTDRDAKVGHLKNAYAKAGITLT